MKKNMGRTDRTIRIMAAFAIALLYYTQVINGITATVLLIVAGIFILTSSFGTCPLYTLLGIRTRRRRRIA